MTDSDQYPEDEDDYNYRLFQQAVQLAFDVTPEFTDIISNYDLLWPPTGKEGRENSHVLNYFQYITDYTTERNPVLSTLAFLFRCKDYHWNEKCDITATEKRVVLSARKSIINKYKTPMDYLRRLRIMLWLPKASEQDFIDDYVDWIQSAWSKEEAQPKPKQ